MRNIGPSAVIVVALSIACSSSTTEQGAAPEVSSEVPVTQAELVASDGSWGNTEGPAVDSTGALYFTSRGTYKGIIKWTKDGGAERYAAVATMAGPGGLWIDAQDSILLTATDEREVQKLAPDGTLTTIAKGFEADPATAKGPNDITASKTGVVYFTDPNGYYGESAPGRVYRIDAAGAVSVFDDTVVGPNGIVISADDRTLYVAHNVAESRTNLVRWPLAEDGVAAGPKEVVAEIDSCVGDGIAIDANGRVWVTCYSFGMAHLVDPSTGQVVHRISTEQKALTNIVFGRGADAQTVYLTSSDMDRVTGYVYKATAPAPSDR